MPEIIAGLIGGGGMTQAAHWLTSRGKVRADTFKTVVEAVTTRLEHTERRLDLVEEQHADCEQNLREVNHKLDNAQREIDRLMQGPVADYTPRIPK